MRFFKEHKIEVEFFDLKKENPTSDSIKSWVQELGIELVLNSKGTKYRSLNLKELNLDENGKIEWLIKEPMLLKRPVIEYGDKVLVAYDEETYKKEFL